MSGASPCIVPDIDLVVAVFSHGLNYEEG
jgi:hypothetical protein